jgi:hypothetical protein
MLPLTRRPDQPSTYVGRSRELSTFVEEWPVFVENLVDEVSADAYSPSSALLWRTVTWVTALAKGRGNLAANWTYAGRPRDAGCEKSLRRERREHEERESADDPTS